MCYCVKSVDVAQHERLLQIAMEHDEATKVLSDLSFEIATMQYWLWHDLFHAGAIIEPEYNHIGRRGGW